jgi:hypothetical protein
MPDRNDPIRSVHITLIYRAAEAHPDKAVACYVETCGVTSTVEAGRQAAVTQWLTDTLGRSPITMSYARAEAEALEKGKNVAMVTASQGGMPIPKTRPWEVSGRLLVYGFPAYRSLKRNSAKPEVGPTLDHLCAAANEDRLLFKLNVLSGGGFARACLFPSTQGTVLGGLPVEYQPDDVWPGRVDGRKYLTEDGGLLELDAERLQRLQLFAGESAGQVPATSVPAAPEVKVQIDRMNPRSRFPVPLAFDELCQRHPGLVSPAAETVAPDFDKTPALKVVMRAIAAFFERGECEAWEITRVRQAFERDDSVLETIVEELRRIALAHRQ